MKKVAVGLFAVVAFGLGLFIAEPLLHAGHGHKMDVEKHLEKMTKKLNLTAEQQAELKTILEEKQQKMQDQMKQMESMMDEYGTKIKGLLNDEQKQKFDKMHGKRKEKCGDKKGCCGMK